MTKEDLQKLLTDDPFNHDARNTYLRLLKSEEDFQSALTQAQILLKQNPADLSAKLEQVECLYELGRWSDAKQAFEGYKVLPGAVAQGDWEVIFQRPPTPMAQAAEASSGSPPVPDSASPAVPGHPEGLRFSDIVGMNELKEEIRLKIITPFLKPELFAKFQKSAGGGVILYGPPGCGKTMFAKAIANEIGATIISVSISDILRRYIGESEENLAAMFAKARALRPSVLFFDELDALGHSRSKSTSEWSRNLTNEFLTQLDGFGADNEGILVLAATNMPWDVDAAFRRPGRFARQIFVSPPDAPARSLLFRLKLKDVPTDHLDYDALGAATPLFSGADIDGVIDHAKEIVLSEILKSGQERGIRQNDLVASLKKFSPSTREWLETVKNIVKYGGADTGYADVEAYLKTNKLL